MKTYIVAYGGSIVISGKTYDHEALERLAKIVENNSDKRFIFIIGGGKLCRFITQEVSSLLDEALTDAKDQKAFANDELGIAVTKINARYTRVWLEKRLGASVVYEDIVINPKLLPQTEKRVIIASGFKPGVSTDYDMMLFAKYAEAESAFKISNFPIVLNVKPTEFDKDKMASYEKLPELSWQAIVTLVGDSFLPGGNYPLDPPSAALGLELLKKIPNFSLYVGQKEEFESMIAGKEFYGTIIKN